MKKAVAVFISLFVVLGFASMLCMDSASAETIELKLAHGFTPKHTMQVKVFEPWAEKITKLTHGKVKFTMFPGGALGKMPDHYSLVEKGLADIVYILQDYTPGRFPMTTVFELPFMIPNATKCSEAMWKIYEKFPAFRKEYSKVKVLALFAHPPGDFHTTKVPIRNIDDFKGLKIRTATPSVTQALKIFGAAPVNMPITETYTALERGVVDGTVVPWEGVATFKLNELLKYSTPAKFYTVTMALLMNKKKWDSLPEDVKKVISENSGLSLSMECGRVYDETDQPNKEICLKSGMQVVELSPEAKATLKSVTEPIREDWVKEMKAKGLPGKEVLDAAINLLK